MALNGINPLSYMGVNTKTPVRVIKNDRDPTERDYEFDLGTIWVNYSAQSAWLLSDVQQDIAMWFQLGVAGAGAENFVTDSGTAVANVDTINWFGDGSSTTTTGVDDDVGNLVSNGTDGQLLIGGGAAPAWSTVTSSDGTINFTLGPNSLDVRASPGLIRVDTDSGFAIPNASNELDIVGDGNAISTAGAGNNVTVSLDNGSNGEVLIGGGAEPTYNTITSTGGTVAITNGANTINLEADAIVPTSFVTDSGTAVPAAGVLNVLGGDDSIETSATGDEFLYVGIENYSGPVSFTPVMEFDGTNPTGLTYATRIGRFAQAGLSLYMNLYIELSSKGSGGSGGMIIRGPAVDFFNVTTFNLRTANITTLFGNNGFNCWGVNSGNILNVSEPRYTGGGLTRITWAQLTNSTIIHMSGVLI